MNITAETMTLMKEALSSQRRDLAKAVSTSTGLAFYDLQGPAKNLYPIVTKLRNMTPRVGRPSGYGTAAHWKQITALTGSGYDAMGWIPEGQRSATMSYTEVDKSAAYVTLGEEDYLTFEAESAAEGFEDLNSTVSLRLLQKTMRKEETALLGGNASLALGTPTVPTLSAPADATSTMPAATYSVIVVALSPEGWLNCKGNAVAGFTPQKPSPAWTGRAIRSTAATRTSRPTRRSPSPAVTVWPPASRRSAARLPMRGSWVLPVRKHCRRSPPSIASISTGASQPGARRRQLLPPTIPPMRRLAFDGFLVNAFEGGTVTTLPTGATGTGTPLTASGRGSIVEIDTMLQAMWDNYRLGPTVIFVSSQEQKNITNKVLSNASGPLLRYDVTATPGEPYAITAGGQIKYYYNPFDGDGMTIPIVPHPDLVAGHDVCVLRAAAGMVPVERGAQRRRSDHAARLLPRRLAAAHAPPRIRHLRRRSPRGVRTVRDGDHHQHREWVKDCLAGTTGVPPASGGEGFKMPTRCRRSQ